VGVLDYGDDEIHGGQACFGLESVGERSIHRLLLLLTASLLHDLHEQDVLGALEPESGVLGDDLAGCSVMIW